MESKQKVIVPEVWARNMETEFANIQIILPSHPLASFDSEFPGVIFNPYKDKPFSPLPPSQTYSLMKANVDALNIIQFGPTLPDADGNLPDFRIEFTYVWQFNFQDFDIETDCCNMDSIMLLQQQGINFFKNGAKGIRSSAFRMFILNSGLLFNRFSLTWISFHNCYDFGFLIKILTTRQLPSDINTFKSLVAYFFEPRVFDMKSILRSCDGLYGGLERVAKTLNVDRVVGKSHQAGSDSLLLLQIFLKLKYAFFKGSYREESSKLIKYQGVLYGFEIKA